MFLNLPRQTMSPQYTCTFNRFAYQHQEYKVQQKVKDAELQTKLTEANLRLSHVEMTNHQAAVFGELSRAHKAVTSTLMVSGAHSQQSSQHSPSDSDSPKAGVTSPHDGPFERASLGGQRRLAEPSDRSRRYPSARSTERSNNFGANEVHHDGLCMLLNNCN